MKCKDCRNLGLLVMPIDGKVVTHINADLASNIEAIKELRMPYCPRVNIPVDVSTDRECGCFTVLIEE